MTHLKIKFRNENLHNYQNAKLLPLPAEGRLLLRWI